MFSKNNLVVWLLVILMLGFVGFQLFWTGEKQKTGYVIIEEIFNSFKLKLELQKKFETTKTVSQKVLDSIQFELQISAGKLDKEKKPEQEEVLKFEQRKEEYFKRKEKSDQDIQALSAEYDKEILAQLNQYVQDYGKENGYVYIFGNDKNGSLMYARDAENITKQVTDYINKKYSGAN